MADNRASSRIVPEMRAVTSIPAPPRPIASFSDLLEFYNRGHTASTAITPLHNQKQRPYLLHLPNLEGRLSGFGVVRPTAMKITPFCDIKDHGFEVRDSKIYPRLPQTNLAGRPGKDTPQPGPDFENPEKHPDYPFKWNKHRVEELNKLFVQLARNLQVPPTDPTLDVVHPHGSAPSLRIPRSVHLHLGMVTRTAHLILYSIDDHGSHRFWVRSPASHSWPGKLNTTVITRLRGFQETALNIVNITAKQNIENASAYIGHLRDDRLVAHHCGYREASDSNLPEGYDPTISHGFFAEVAEEWRPRVKNTQPFQSFTLDELKRNLMLKRFTPASAVVLVHFLKREGLIAEKEARIRPQWGGPWLEDYPYITPS